MLLDFVSVALSLPVVAFAGYLALLAILSRSLPSAPYPSPRTKFDVIVPAHNEEKGIAPTVASLLGLDYPLDMRRVVVVADNCTDATAARAREAGAAVIERNDTSRRGKGYALADAFAASLRDPTVHAVAVVDADTVVDENLLRAFDARLQHGAHAVQACYSVSNRTASWRTRLMHVGFTLFHDVRSNARERLGVSAGLRGNGMAFSSSLMREVPHEAFTIVEDVEYGIRMGFAGYRVHYAGDARVLGEMPVTAGAARSQRQRWELGRWLLVRRHAGPLLREAFRRRSRILLDLAADLLVPPLSYVGLAVASGVVGSALWWLVGRGSWWAFAPWCLASFGLALYVARGVWLADVGPRFLLDVFCVPVYVLWKIGVTLKRASARKGEWVRTTRDGERP